MEEARERGGEEREEAAEQQPQHSQPRLPTPSTAQLTRTSLLHAPIVVSQQLSRTTGEVSCEALAFVTV